MVRTKANNAAVRKAVAAKAPRKNLGGPRTVSNISSPSSRKGRKSKLGSSSNPVKQWPTPSWQKGIGSFLSPNSKEGTSSTSGECSSGSTTQLTKEDEESNARELDDQPVQATSDGEEREEEVGGASDQSSCSDEEEDLMSEESEEEESEMDESETAASKIAMLDKDLVGSSDDDD